MTDELGGGRLIAPVGRGGDSVPDADGENAEWWAHYKASLIAEGFPAAALSVLDLDSSYILEEGVFGAGEPTLGESEWPSGRLRTGLVVGSVQSGKTASMFATAAKAFDSGVDIVVLLAGSRTALWLQTYQRMSVQLDAWKDKSEHKRKRGRRLMPRQQFMRNVAAGKSNPEPLEIYHLEPKVFASDIKKNKPLLVIAMKQTDHLIGVSSNLKQALAVGLETVERPIHMLVIDDECDDGSVLDAFSESGLPPGSLNLKQVPRNIAGLWGSTQSPVETFRPNLFTTYLGYTASPQANLVQFEHNPLAPRDFIVALRTAGDFGLVEPPRQICYTEPVGVIGHYCGGDLFYEKLRGQPGDFCIARPFPERKKTESDDVFNSRVELVREEMLTDSLRGYFVSGAIRLLLSGKRFAVAREAAPGSKEAVKVVLPDPHTMLYHPSARVEEHLAGAQEIAAWSFWPPAEPGAGVLFETDGAGRPILSIDGLKARLDHEEDEWAAWMSKFEDTRTQLRQHFPAGKKLQGVAPEMWSEVKQLLLDEVFPNVRLSIVNSDDRYESRPDFQPIANEFGEFELPRDIYTIFVSGNVMSRGLTLEGLCTSLFLRKADEPAADTQAQMQRWFGYRGRHLAWCRIFLFLDQYELFREYHEDDLLRRTELIAAMNSSTAKAPDPTVLEGRVFKATNKVKGYRTLPLCPGPTPFVKVVETGIHATHNLNMLSGLLEGHELAPLLATGVKKGLITERPLPMLAVAELLESFRFSHHCPASTDLDYKQWANHELALGLKPPIAPLYRPPGGGEANALNESRSCPYAIASYLRLWDAALTRKVSGLRPTDQDIPWSQISLQEYLADKPDFYVGVRFGNGGEVEHPALAKFDILRAKRAWEDGVLTSTLWGTSDPDADPGEYRNDKLFDYHHTGLSPSLGAGGEPQWRPRGHPGLLLFYVLNMGDDNNESLAMGLALPLGGPDRFTALRAIAPGGSLI